MTPTSSFWTREFEMSVRYTSVLCAKKAVGYRRLDLGDLCWRYIFGSCQHMVFKKLCVWMRSLRCVGADRRKPKLLTQEEKKKPVNKIRMDC